MNRYGIILFLGILFSPFYALAHGEEILVSFFIQLALIFFFLIWVIIVKLRIVDKLILIGSYFISLFIIIILTWNVSYRENRFVLDVFWTTGPVLISIVTFIALRNRDKKRRSSSTDPAGNCS